MINSLVKLRYFAIALILTAMILPVFSAKADQAFTYSDDLSSNYSLDMFQTRAKITGGRAYTADDSTSSEIVSYVISNPQNTIISARVDVSGYTPSNGRIVYYVSNNNGQRWTQINPGYTYSFDSVGNQLRWKAVIIRESFMVGSPYLDSIYITYTVSDTLAVSQNNTYSNYYNGYTNNSGTSIGLNNDPNSLVCSALSLVGLGCGAVPPAPFVNPVQQPINSYSTAPTSVVANSNVNTTDSNGSGNGSNLSATIFTAGKKQEGSDSVNLVRVKGKEEIYEIVGGKKHFIPTMDIFYDYGFKIEWVQDITQNQLDKFPRIKLMQVTGNKKKTYYFTEGGMVRLIPDKNVFNSYGDREEDIIVISKKEFNFYPQNQFVFLENPLNRDVFQIVQGKTKRYLTPQAVKRLKIDTERIAPINQAELTTYKTDKPVVL